MGPGAAGHPEAPTLATLGEALEPSAHDHAGHERHAVERERAVYVDSVVPRS